MPLLTANEDDLRGDPLRTEKLSNYDPVSKEASKRVKIYDKDLGFAVHPEEKESILKWKSDIDTQYDKNQGMMNTFRSGFEAAKSKADKEFESAMAAAKKKYNVKSMKLIPVRVVSADGNSIEGTYYLPKEVGESIAKEKEFVSRWGDDGSFNVSVRTKHGYTRGQELHDELRKGSDTVKKYKGLESKAKRALQIQLDAAKKEYGTSRGEATKTFNQEYSQAETFNNQMKGKYSTFIADQRAKFAQAKADVNSTTSKLLASGALEEVGSYK